ncbi:MAG: gamma carbonic anhydrase family protein [Spirochaetales bacterium]|nr:gamma carbonic anhydrase family protein [Spirochaetales bacterium]
MVIPFEDKTPDTEKSLFIAWNAHVCGDVTLGKNSAVWYGTTIRGDIASIRIGDGTNIQDNSVCHVTIGFPLTVGNNVTVGHGVIIHGCTIGDNCLIGMGSTIMDGAEIGEYSMVGAGTLIPPGKKFPPRSLILGVPGKVVREITEKDEEKIRASAERYVENSKKFAISEAKNLKFEQKN